MKTKLLVLSKLILLIYYIIFQYQNLHKTSVVVKVNHFRIVQGLRIAQKVTETATLANQEAVVGCNYVISHFSWVPYCWAGDVQGYHYLHHHHQHHRLYHH